MLRGTHIVNPDAPVFGVLPLSPLNPAVERSVRSARRARGDLVVVNLKGEFRIVAYDFVSGTMAESP